MTTLRGRVVSGRGLGTKHIADASDELELLLGERPYPGSLNVILDEPVKLSKRTAMAFDGGQRLLWPARLNGVPAWLYRWHHAPLHVVELIASRDLRRQLNLDTASRVQIEVDSATRDSVPFISWAILWAGRRKWVYRTKRYNQLVSSIAAKTGFGVDSPLKVITKTGAGVLRKLRLISATRPYFFSRVKTDGLDCTARQIRQVLNLLNYTKTSNTSYSAQKFPAGYHSIKIHQRRFKGQREPNVRLQQVPIDFAEKSVLDLGSNQGGMLHQLADKLKWGVGVDFDPRMVNAANRIKSIRRTDNLCFYVHDLEKQDLQLIRDFLPEERVNVCFLLSVCMWISNWREVIDFAGSISDVVLFESNGTSRQQEEQIHHLESHFALVTPLADESEDDPGQRNRKLLLARF